MGDKKERFKLSRFLGAGGFARTYLAEVIDAKLRKDWGKEVVIKIPHDKEKEEVLINELIMNAGIHLNLQKARSRNVVPYLGYSKYEDLFVMVMEYIEGTVLRDLIGPVGSQRPLDIDTALNIAEQVCEGLVEIHRVHVFHRDIKPENILIAKKYNTAMIMDLGISRFLSSAEFASTTTGTIYYMAKELLTKEGGSFYSDIYSLGITMYEMVTGQLPFTGGAIYEIIDRILNEEAVPPRQLNPQVDEKLNKIVLKAMHKETAKRYATAEDMLKALRAYRQGGDEEDEPIGRCIAEAQELFSLGNVRAAETKLKELVNEYPKNPRSYLGLGEFYNRCQRYHDAISAFQEGLQVDAGFAFLYRDIALSFFAIGSKKEAIEALRKAIEFGMEPSLEKHAIKLLELWDRK